MKIQNISISGYRNIDQINLKLHDRLTILVGKNGMGKTNILEAIHLLSFPRSFRGTADKLLMGWEAEFSRIEGVISTDNDDKTTSIVFFLSPQKKLLIDGQSASGSDYVGNFLSILFAPEEVDLLSGPPGHRRAFLDAHLSQLSRSYFFHLLNYNKVVKQRNKLLSSPLSSLSELEYWNDQQVGHGVELIEARLNTISHLNELLSPALTMNYNCSFAFDSTDNLGSSLESAFHNKQSSIIGRERLVGHSMLGPHRDDWQLLETGETTRDLGVYGSRGEQRISVVALKRAELALIKQQSGQNAVLLLDDVLSELDTFNQQLLIKELGEQQTIITTASLSDIPEDLLKDAYVYEVEEGVANLTSG